MAEHIQASFVTSIVNNSRFHILKPARPYGYMSSYLICKNQLGLEVGAITSKVEYDLIVNSIKSFLLRNNIDRNISVILGLVGISGSEKPVDSTQQFLHIGGFQDKSFFIKNNTFPWNSDEPKLNKDRSKICTIMRSETNFLYHTEGCFVPVGDIFICRENLKNVPSTSETSSPITSQSPSLSPSTSPSASPTVSPLTTPTVSPSNLPTVSPKGGGTEPTFAPSRYPGIGEIDIEYGLPFKLFLAGLLFAMILIITLLKVFFKVKSNKRKLESELLFVKNKLDYSSSTNST